MADLFVVLAILLVVFAALMTLIIMRRRPASIHSVRVKPVSMERVWEDWVNSSPNDDAERVRRNALFTSVVPRHRDAVREDLLRFEAQALAEPEPLFSIRRELMDSVDRRMLNQEILSLPDGLKKQLRAQSGDVISSDEEAAAYLAANELRLEVLREYAARRYGDRAERDWFQLYERASMLKQRSARNFIVHSMSGELNDDQDARQQAISLVDSQLRAHLLKVAPGTQFRELPGSEDGA